LLDQAGRAEMVSAAMSELGHLGAEAHAKAFALTKGGRVGVVGSGGARRNDIRGNERGETGERSQETD